jgi:hypothetical protein
MALWSAVALAATLMASNGRAAVLAYSSVQINSYQTVNDPAPDFIESSTGGDLQASATGSRVLGYSNGSGQVLGKQTSDNVYANASLQAGQLKALSSFSFGADQNIVPMPVGQTNGAASADAVFGDSFRAYSSSTPYLWSSGDTATFSFGITGSTSETPGLPVPLSYDLGQTNNQVSSYLSINIYQPGTMDLYYQWGQIDIDANLTEWLAVADQIEANHITGQNFCLGAAVAVYCQPGQPFWTLVTLNSGASTPIEFSFNPDGDFDWLVRLSTTVHLDASQQNVFATRDFSQTITAGYDGPPGTTTYSGSGLFPDTVPLSTVPLPGAGWLLTTGVLGLLGRFVRRREMKNRHP